MFIPGEQVRGLLCSDAERYIICAPFIKRGAFTALLQCIPQSENSTIEVYTRWVPAEVAAGVSDLEVYEICASRRNTNLYLTDGLHAKLFAADQACLVGSANVTDRALGWIYPSNIELLIPSVIEEPSVANLVQRLQRFSERATAEKKAEVAEAAANLTSIDLPEAVELEDGERKARKWLPNCRKPQLIFRLYTSGHLRGELSSMASAAEEDLRFLNPPNGLDSVEFDEFVRQLLRSLPLFEELLRLVARDELVNGVGRRLIQSLEKSNLTEEELENYWSNVREWLIHFYKFRAEASEFRIVAGMRDE